MNRTPIKMYDSALQAITAQFILHFILNLTYPNGDKAHYYAFLEILCGLRPAKDIIKSNKTLKSFFNIFNTNVD